MSVETAQDRADREGLTQIAVVPGELMGVAVDGHPVIVRTVDGQEVLLRLPTVEEAMRFNREAIESVGQMMSYDPNWEGPPPMTEAQARELVEPLGTRLR